MKVLSRLGKLFLCLLPAALTPLWAFLISDGYLNFGAGEKDLFMLVPWMLWALMFSIIFIITWIRSMSTRRTLLYSAGGATLILSAIWIVMFIWFNDLLGVYKG